MVLVGEPPAGVKGSRRVSDHQVPAIPLHAAYYADGLVQKDVRHDVLAASKLGEYESATADLFVLNERAAVLATASCMRTTLAAQAFGSVPGGSTTAATAGIRVRLTSVVQHDAEAEALAERDGGDAVAEGGARVSVRNGDRHDTGRQYQHVALIRG